MSDRLEECRADLIIRKPLTNEQCDWLVSEVERLRSIGCRGDDQTCPCHDGDQCHYRGDPAWLTPDERAIGKLTLEVERLRAELANPPPDVQELVLEKLGIRQKLVRLEDQLIATSDELAAAQKRIEFLLTIIDEALLSTWTASNRRNRR